MKNTIGLSALLMLITIPSFAATKVVKTTHATTSEPATEPTPHTITHSNQPELSADFGLGSVDSRFAFGVGFKAQWPVSFDTNDFKFGGRTGFYLAPSSPTGFIIPILATAEYEFHVDNALKPYVGLEMGVSITHVSAGNGVYSVSNTSTDFAFLVVPGFNFGDHHEYFVEVPFGTMASDFAIIPSIGMHF